MANKTKVTRTIDPDKHEVVIVPKGAKVLTAREGQRLVRVSDSDQVVKVEGFVVVADDSEILTCIVALEEACEKIGSLHDYHDIDHYDEVKIYAVTEIPYEVEASVNTGNWPFLQEAK